MQTLSRVVLDRPLRYTERPSRAALVHPGAFAPRTVAPAVIPSSPPAGPPRGVLVTGSHRSGTTWVGKMVAHARGTVYLHEPFKPGWDPPYAFVKFPHYFTYVGPHNAAQFEAPLGRTLGLHWSYRKDFARAPSVGQAFSAAGRWARWASRRSAGRFPVLKDPIALFSAPWLAERFGLGVVVMIRHPAAFASSIKLKRWSFNFNHLLAQPELMSDRLAPFEREILRLARREADLVDQAILLWRAFHHVIRSYQHEHPDWLFVRHEDLSLDPVAGFRQVYRYLGLEFDACCESSVRQYSDDGNVRDANAAGRSTHDVRVNSAANVKNWRTRLTPAEIEKVRAGTADVAWHFYGDADWE